jgi:HK97 family phage major capsid protein
MTYAELIEKRTQLVTELESAITTGKQEERKLSTVEENEVARLTNALTTLDAEIEQKQNNNKNTRNKNKMENKFSLLKAISAKANGTSIEDYADFMEIGKAQMRKAGLNFVGDIVIPAEYRSDILAGTDNQGQEVVAEDKWVILPPLRDSLVLAQAGATVMTGLVGDVSIPTYAGTTALWKGEVAAAGDGGGAFDEVLLAPKRLTTYIDISKQFLLQDSASAEAMLMQDIIDAVTTKLETTILSAASGTTVSPAGIFYNTTDVTGSTVHATLVAMEKELAESKVTGDYAFIMAPSVKATLRTTQAATNLDFILNNSQVIGYPYFSTNAVPSTRIALGRWSDLVIGQWGSYDITVDPYTVAINGKVRIVINSYFDAKFRRPVAYETATIS